MVVWRLAEVAKGGSHEPSSGCSANLPGEHGLSNSRVADSLTMLVAWGSAIVSGLLDLTQETAR
jgi:hypothetical protein